MKIGIMQPYFFPYLGYWQLIGAVDKYVVYDDVSYIKGGWINRNNILLGGQKHLITIPLENSSSFKNINEINITKDIIALKKVIKILESAYIRAPYFEVIMPMIRDLILNSSTIALLNYNTIVKVNEYLGISTQILLSSDIEKDCTLKAQEKVIHINKILGSDTYYNAIGGQKLYNSEKFRENDIRLNFLQMEAISYKQFKNEFVSGLSIIDVMMFNDIETVKSYLRKFTLLYGE